MNNMRVINTSKKTESFGAKANMLNLDIDEQIKMLNSIYKGEVRFVKTPRHKIGVAEVHKDVICIAFPETDNLDELDLFHSIYWKKDIVSTVKLPKAFKTLDMNARWLHSVSRVFVWDTTKIVGDVVPNNINLLVVQQSSGRKPRILKNTIKSS